MPPHYYISCLNLVTVLRNLLIILLLFVGINAFGQQQDVEFHLQNQLLTGVKILKVKRDYNDPYLWVLAQNNQVYRVNSQTFAIDDYTSQFAAYNNLQFTDIAGLNKDTVYVSANSPNVIEYEKGILKMIGQSNGLADNVTSIGIGSAYIFSNLQGEVLFIATTKGMGNYDVKNENLIYNIFSFNYYDYNKYGPANIFTMTYRNKMTTYPEDGYITGVNDYPVAIITPYEGYSTYIAHNPNNLINTAFYNLTQNNLSVYGGSSFWGNANGLYQQSLHWENTQEDTLYYHCLNGIKVNKIADILGLTSFYNTTKDDLLVGTDNGLYFTSSLNDNDYNEVLFGNGYGDLIGPGFSTFFCNEVGNVAVNDICTNATTQYFPYTGDYCENGVWLATNNGIYFIVPDYGKYIDPNSRLSNTIYFSHPATTDSIAQLCIGDSAKLNVNPADTSHNLIQWQKNGQDIIGATKAILTVADSGDYNVIVYDPCSNVHIQSNHLQIGLISAPIFTFNYPDTLQYCDSTSATLNVTNSLAYHYRWYQNGALTSDTTSKFTTTQSGKYYVEVSACSGTWYPSKPVQVELINIAQPVITGDKAIYCQSETATLTTSTIPDSSYIINWYKDGVLILVAKNQITLKTSLAGNYEVTVSSNMAACGKTSLTFPLAFVQAPTFTFNYPGVLNYCAGSTATLTVQGNPAYRYRWYKNDTLTTDTTTVINVTQTGLYRVEVSACQNSWVPSNNVQVNFIQIPNPVLTTDKPAYCSGDNATLSVSAPVQASYTINWYNNNTLLSSYTNQTSLITNIPGSYTVSIVSNVTNTDGTICAQTSAAKAISFNSKPQVSIQQIVNTTLCQGQTVNLKAIYTGDGTVTWSNGESGSQTNVNSAGIYTATLTTTAGCTADTSITVAFLTNPVLNVNDTTICTYKNQTVVLNAPAGYAQYSWNGQQGNSFYSVTKPQTVTLTVTDANGCQAAAQIKVIEQCADVEIPNAFTPNGDGINDYWQVEGLDNTATINVFNRYGALVYQSKGYATPWDGTYRGAKLPAGVYYYIVKVKGDTQTFSGSVTILY